MVPKDETINQRVARYRRAACLNQTQMAEKLGLKGATYAQRERLGVIDPETLKKIAVILKVDICILLYGDDYVKKPEDFQTRLEDVLSKKEIKLLTAFRNLSQDKKKSVFEYAYSLLKNK